MRDTDVITTLFQHAGQVLTPQVAHAIVAELFPERAIDPAQFAPQRYEGLVFQAESFRMIREQLHAQHQQHWDETEHYRSASAMHPDYDYMAAQERAGNLLQFVVRAEDKLVGNMRVYLYRDLHTQQLCATEDTLYLAPEARRGFAASRFTDYVTACLARLGVIDAYVDTKILRDAQGNVVRDVGVLIQRKGWSHIANRFHKRLNEE